jgi:hypothetical protein
MLTHPATRYGEKSWKRWGLWPTLLVKIEPSTKNSWAPHQRVLTL